MKSIPILTTVATIAVAQIGYASASFNVRQVSSTSTSTDTPTPTLPVSDSVTSTGSVSSASITSEPTISSNPFANVSSVGTQTLSGIRPSVATASSLIESLSLSSPNAAATPVRFGAGVLAGILGVAAVL
ncbi:hypothetical protein F4815DRAFT_444252 [Daldinia loculata]|nr:hypothetical protein F4815DRAFT_444252 [Daldinia loculata]